MPLHPRTCSGLYSISCLLDALDGVAARYFQQSTRFGAVLDMVTDRCTTACLLVFLSSAWPRWALLFQGLISLDLASHYMHMYATLTMAGSGQSHKKVDQSRSRLLHLYYNNKVLTPILRTKSSNSPRSNRASFSRSVLSTSYSSLLCICSPSLLQYYRHRFFQRITPLGHLLSQEVPQIPLQPFLRPQAVHGQWSWPGQTRWTVSGRGS